MIHSTAFIHDKALIDDNVSIVEETRVWGFSHILKQQKLDLNVIYVNMFL